MHSFFDMFELMFSHCLVKCVQYSPLVVSYEGTAVSKLDSIKRGENNAFSSYGDRQMAAL